MGVSESKSWTRENLRRLAKLKLNGHQIVKLMLTALAVSRHDARQLTVETLMGTYDMNSVEDYSEPIETCQVETS